MLTETGEAVRIAPGYAIFDEKVGFKSVSYPRWRIHCALRWWRSLFSERVVGTAMDFDTGVLSYRRERWSWRRWRWERIDDRIFN